LQRIKINANLITVRDLVNYFDSIETAKAFCENMFFNVMYNDNKYIVSACSETWQETFNY